VDFPDGEQTNEQLSFQILGMNEISIQPFTSLSLDLIGVVRTISLTSRVRLAKIAKSKNRYQDNSMAIELPLYNWIHNLSLRSVFHVPNQDLRE
jgi:hypothetical protein